MWNCILCQVSPVCRLRRQISPGLQLSGDLKRGVVTRRQDFIVNGDGGDFELQSFIFEIYTQ